MSKDDLFDLEKEYNNLKKKYKLPDFEKLNNEFELSSYKDIDPKFLLRNIRKRIIEKVASIVRFLEEILHPSGQSIVIMNEIKFFDENKLNGINSLLKRFMLIARQSLVLDTGLNESENADFITAVLKEWPDLKKELRVIAIVLRDSWKEEEKTDTESYFG
ncbi:hypothetical protein HYX19_05080 [Candidatus Woesearchaeota archaeon]|nr:hypothetical protein [Candidatus Woesearchaeota archaeon]